MKVYNTLSRRKEEFQPLDPPAVKMYVCGITPYDETHLGHGRAYVTFDLVRRWLEFSGFQVTYVQNITDVDDKIIAKGQGARVKCQELVEKYTRSYFEVMDRLNVRRADRYPKATEHIPEMVRWIGGLVERGYAYLLDDGVYFEVNKFAAYGKLSGRKKEEQEAGARVEVDNRKRNPLDFALWKKAKEGEPSWPSPWGAGRPGWHMECSVMSTKYLGEQFDIHGGGMDLEFPHHENEIAQAESFIGKPWVKYWLHNGFVNVNKQKMSKSLGNFFTLKDIFQKFNPMVVRLFLLLTHYRSPIDFSDEQLLNAKSALLSIEESIRDFDLLTVDNKAARKIISSESDIDKIRQNFKLAMDDDFNTAQALAVVFSLVHLMNQRVKLREYDPNMKNLLIELLDILGLKVDLVLPDEIQTINEEISRHRANKEYQQADQGKEKIRRLGFSVRDTSLGTLTSGSSTAILLPIDPSRSL